MVRIILYCYFDCYFSSVGVADTNIGNGIRADANGYSSANISTRVTADTGADAVSSSNGIVISADTEDNNG